MVNIDSGKTCNIRTINVRLPPFGPDLLQWEELQSGGVVVRCDAAESSATQMGRRRKALVRAIDRDHSFRFERRLHEASSVPDLISRPGRTTTLRPSCSNMFLLLAQMAPMATRGRKEK